MKVGGLCIVTDSLNLAYGYYHFTTVIRAISKLRTFWTASLSFVRRMSSLGGSNVLNYGEKIFWDLTLCPCRGCH